jgi:hypothetical protein
MRSKMLACSLGMLVIAAGAEADPIFTSYSVGGAASTESRFQRPGGEVFCSSSDGHVALGASSFWSATGCSPAIASAQATATASGLTNSLSAGATATATGFSSGGDAGGADSQAFAIAASSDTLYFEHGGVWASSGGLDAKLSVSALELCSNAKVDARVTVGTLSFAYAGDACGLRDVSKLLDFGPITIPVGGFLSFSANLFVSAAAARTGPQTTTASADALHTLTFFFSPLTPGATVVSASGTDFVAPTDPQPVPEPSTILMLASGVVTVAYSKWRKRIPRSRF